jgi:oxygen-independent coproporphyrinogen-3 oxidase
VAGVYISFPFCSQKCTYCNFASGVFPPALVDAYLRALDAEIRAFAWPWTPETLYVGGGTPSTLAPEVFLAILSAVPGRPWKEATLEAAPGSITAGHVRTWAECGINRVSLGVQSFVEAELRRTGRRHNAAIVERDVAVLRAGGIENISIDLIAGLPGQTAASWRESLTWLERLAVPHVSIYMLEVNEDSRLGREILGGGLRFGAPDVPGEDAITEFYEQAVDFLAALGVERYEISNFARPGHESLHNLKYWRLEPYAGFGADAHSFDGALRWQNVETAQEYVDRFARGETRCAAESPAAPDEERFYVGLRLLEGIEPSDEERRRHAQPIARFLDAGLLEESGGRLRLTRRGVLLSNEVFQEFLPS